VNRPPSCADNPLRVQLNIPIAVLTLVILPLLVGLGFWQLDRAAQKRSLEERLAHQQAEPPMALTPANMTTLPVYRRVIAEGHFDNEHTWLLDNKQRQGRVGYEVVTPFKFSQGGAVLINRGWVAGTGDRRQLPPIPTVEGEQTLFAQLVAVSEHPLLNAHSTAVDWPRVVMAIEPVIMAEQWGQSLLADRYLQLDASSAGALETTWPLMNMSAQKHTGYAVQWFAMAFALVIWFVVANTNVLVWWRARKERAL